MSLQVRPWNRVPQAVYSLSTVDNDRLNMNICTYVSPMTMEPKQYMIGLFHNTKTFENLKKSGEALLQILGTHQTRYINALGKKSGLTIDKDTYLRKRVSFPKSPAHLAYLKDCLAYVHLSVKTWTPESDHDLVFCETLSWKNIQTGIPLTTTYLKEKKIIR
ncbi:MAG: flavin reductase family protein [Prochlorotrichaceae cyanobacterium]